MNRIYPKQVCANIKTKRLEQRITMQYMAGALSVSISTYSTLENGQTPITLSRLQQIADVLQVKVTELLYDAHSDN